MPSRTCAVVLAALALAFTCAGVSGQSAPRPVRIAMVCGVRCNGAAYDAFWRQLRELGRVEGRDCVTDIRGAEWQPHRMKTAKALGLTVPPKLLLQATETFE